MIAQQVILKIMKCYNWKALYALAEELLQCGLYLGSSTGGNRLLCRIANGQPQHKSIFDDYIILGGRDEYASILPELKNQIVTFVLEHSNDETLANQPNYQKFAAFYGKPIFVDKERSLAIEQHIRAISDVITEG